MHVFIPISNLHIPYNQRASRWIVLIQIIKIESMPSLIKNRKVLQDKELAIFKREASGSSDIINYRCSCTFSDNRKGFVAVPVKPERKAEPATAPLYVPASMFTCVCRCEETVKKEKQKNRDSVITKQTLFLQNHVVLKQTLFCRTMSFSPWSLEMRLEMPE